MSATTTFTAMRNPAAHKNSSSIYPSSSNSLKSHIASITRRSLLVLPSLSFTLSTFLASPREKNHTTYADYISLPDSDARGLFQMPPIRLINRYYLVRAGESEYESLGIINTNPVAKTSMDNGLSEEGKKQVVRAALELKSMGACENSCWIWPSITQRAYQAAEVVAAINGISRSHIVPEYSFLDARGLGAFEGRKLDSIFEAHVRFCVNGTKINPRMLEQEASQVRKGFPVVTIFQVYASDIISPSMKPPPVDDGTPNESVQDVFVRVTQLMSILETQYSEDTVIIVSPDSDNLSVLQAGLLGLDLRRHHDLAFKPGEVRFVDAASIPTYKQPASAVYKCVNPPNCK